MRLHFFASPKHSQTAGGVQSPPLIDKDKGILLQNLTIQTLITKFITIWHRSNIGHWILKLNNLMVARGWSNVTPKDGRE